MSRPARPAPLLALVLATLLLVAMVAQVPTTLGAWIATTDNPGNSFATGTVEPPTGFNARCESRTQVDLTWGVSPTGAVTGYHIERKRDNESTFTHLVTVDGLSYSDSSAFPSSLLSLLVTLDVEYRISTEIADVSWRSTPQEASTSGTVIAEVLGVPVFDCH